MRTFSASLSSLELPLISECSYKLVVMLILRSWLGMAACKEKHFKWLPQFVPDDSENVLFYPVGNEAQHWLYTVSADRHTTYI